MEIGPKLRELRIAKNLTQEELADRAELSKGFISQLERDLTSPSIATLVDILQCLGTTINEFFSEDPEEQVVFHYEDYFEKEDEHKNSITWLIATAQSRSMEPILVQLQPGQSMPEDKPHEGEEFGYVLDGEIRLHYGEDVYTVRKGDSFIFPANRKHKISSACKKVSSVLWISSPPSF